MYFKNLPKHIQEGIKALTVDKVFQERFGHDKILDELDDEKYNKAEAFQELMFTLGRCIKTKSGLSIKPITIKSWTILYGLDSPFIKFSNNSKEPNITDADLFLYAVNNELKDEELLEYVSSSFGYCEKNNIKLDEAFDIISQLIRYSFSPLKMFPVTRVQIAGEIRPIFDVDWMTSLAAQVHEASGWNVDDIISKKSLTACLYYYVQNRRKNGESHIERRTSEEVEIMQAERTDELICDRLIELGIMKPEEREEMMKIMTTKPE